MFKEATVYAPVVEEQNGRVTVTFSPDHPGHADPDYQRHRAAIARAALDYRAGDPVPVIDYTDAEHELWSQVSAELATWHEQHACREFLDGTQRLALATDAGVPQLAEVARRLREITGFTFSPAAGLVPVQEFYGTLAERRFQATQYIRHASYPRFSPEPDMLHEVIGHGSALSNPNFVGLYELVGRTVRRLETLSAVKLVSSVFWFTMEYGIVREAGVPKVCGASLLSSCSELEQFGQVRLTGLDVEAMATHSYDVDHFQPLLYCADSFAHLEDWLGSFLEGMTDEVTITAEHESATVSM